MEHKKDNSGKRTLFPYHKDNPLSTNSFGENIQAEQAFKKTERILAGLYVLTNAVPHTEPLFKTIRSKGHLLLTNILNLRTGFGGAESNAVFEVVGNVRELITYVHLLKAAGYASDQVTDLMTAALDELGHQVTEAAHASISNQRLALTRTDLTPPVVPHETVAEPRSSVPSRTQSSSPQRSTSRSAPQQSRPSTSMRGAHSERRMLILSALRAEGELGIKEIAKHVPGCSEKTIQRELTQLISENIVKKEGEKRWSKYSIKR